MLLIDGERPGGLSKCCANISGLRDVLIGIARDGGQVHAFARGALQRNLSWCWDSHDLDTIPVMKNVLEQMEMQGASIEHQPFDGPESLIH